MKILAGLFMFSSFSLASTGLRTPDFKQSVHFETTTSKSESHLHFLISPLQIQSDWVRTYDMQSHFVNSNPLGFGLAMNQHYFFLDHSAFETESGNDTLSVRHKNQNFMLSYYYHFFQPQKWLSFGLGFGAGFSEETIENRLQDQIQISRTGRQNILQANLGSMASWKMFFLGFDLKLQNSQVKEPNTQFSWAAKAGLQFTIF